MVKTGQVDAGKFVAQISSDLDVIMGLIKTLTSKVDAYNRKYKAKIKLKIDVTLDDNPFGSIGGEGVNQAPIHRGLQIR